MTAPDASRATGASEGGALSDAPETPDQFADRIARGFWRGPLDDTDPMGVRDLLVERQARYGYPLDADGFEQSGGGQGLIQLVERFYGELLTHTPTAFQRFCAAHVSVRGVPSFTIEGAVYASGHGSYAVIVTTAFMTFLNKMKKLLFAETDPSVVEYCNRMPAADLTPDIVRGMRDEVVEAFRHGDPRGPLLLLDLDRAAAVTVMLDIQEAFLVAHEIGHLLSDYLLRSMLANTLHESFGSADHRAEYCADMIGFALTLRRSLTDTLLAPDPIWKSRTTSDSAPGMTPQTTDNINFVPKRQTPTHRETVRIASICEFFEILELASPAASPSHPAPVDRAANLLATFYGEHFAAHYNAVRAGEARYDWASQFAKGVKPSGLGRTCMALLANEKAFEELVELAAIDGPDALKTRIASSAPYGSEV
ncbi:hypothetical protein [Sphingomonas sp. PP-CE-1G-424]|uniref:hypothetical protein n=1 Tax=Sphingomonas sp. PP-CE-1G-424 TaxID=2135658 RepID=UPI001054E306|nr:hypothetical protein [Sphingomonas sp. PP-CE-1G-424]TCP71527.1 hypothetical protein C8J43_102608 [Sphingomonas sp. PP-CE-1G-424]